MRIAQVAPPLERVPPRQYGGTERVVSTLTEELVRRGHDVTLFASGDSQREPVADANWVATVHHGIDLDGLAFGARAGGYLAFLGRISSEKGVDTAIRVAQRAGMPLRIAGRMPLPYKDDPEARRDWE